MGLDWMSRARFASASPRLPGMLNGPERLQEQALLSTRAQRLGGPRTGGKVSNRQDRAFLLLWCPFAIPIGSCQAGRLPPYERVPSGLSVALLAGRSDFPAGCVGRRWPLYSPERYVWSATADPSFYLYASLPRPSQNLQYFRCVEARPRDLHLVPVSGRASTWWQRLKPSNAGDPRGGMGTRRAARDRRPQPPRPLMAGVLPPLQARAGRAI